MDKRFWGILVAVVLVLGGVFWATNSGNNSSSGNGKPTSHVEGQGKAGIKLVEYGDYECPFCAQYYPVVKQVASTYSQDIYVQFRNLPLTQLHPNAYVGARAAEAAAMQNKFWQMHDKLYEENLKYVNAQAQGQTYNTWVTASNPESYFVQYAKQMGLNITKFNQDFNSAKVNNLIQADMNQFPKDYKSATGSYDPNKDEATPTFFLGGKIIQPGVFYQNGLINSQATFANFEKDINAAIKKKGFTPPTGTTSSSPSSAPASSGSTQSKQ